MESTNDRINYIIKLYQKLNPDIKITRFTEIKNTTIEKLCQYNGAPYQRIKVWCEQKVKKLELEKISNSDTKLFAEEMTKCYELMKSRNEKYGDSWKRLRLNAVVDLMIMKLDRCQKQELNNEAIRVELEDVVNYGIFGLLKLKQK